MASFSVDSSIPFIPSLHILIHHTAYLLFTGKWVARQREDATDGIMSDERKRTLDEVGFIWQVKKKSSGNRNTAHIDEKWNNNYQQLVEFKNHHGHCNPPVESPLNKWIKGQRVIFNRGLMPKSRIKKLEELDFVFSYDSLKKQQNWSRMYELLKLCQREDSGFDTARAGDEAASLARWMTRQRDKYKTNKLDPGREALLRTLDFRFPDRNSLLGDLAGGAGSGTAGGGGDIDVQAAGLLTDNADDLVARLTNNNNGYVGGIRIGMDGAGMADKTNGVKVAESVNVLAQFLSISPEEVANRVSNPAPASDNNDHGESGSPEGRLNAFGRLMPLIVRLKETVDAAALRDCVEFLEVMVQRAKVDLQPEPKNNVDVDDYNRLLSLVVDLDSLLDNSQRSRAVVESCESYFHQMMVKFAGRKRASSAITGLAEEGAEKRYKAEL